jgi:hypothetical protein
MASRTNIEHIPMSLFWGQECGKDDLALFAAAKAAQNGEER